MVTTERTFRVNVPVERARAYLRDFANAIDWDPGTVSCVQQDDGPIAQGTKWDNVSEVFGRKTDLTYELTRDDPQRIIFKGTNKTATSIDDITLTEIGDGALDLRYRSEVTFNGIAKVASPFLKVAFTKIAAEMERDMPGIIEQKA
ncbi:SRPBCC family protein [Branchiibius sp. NY16-3462-2]|uniref:SRPBCC family protein n=1 Tax=Branchiibius sp. NY16-3462-2 TaxID=1807500 RepID=UPI000797FE20|nr:SRPBCC family protein [Branchiibius sp. NY16-3462-2]KYH44530.1 polyketide cyclase [Branchiibius sp. NY16-3462-2]